MMIVQKNTVMQMSDASSQFCSSLVKRCGKAEIRYPKQNSTTWFEYLNMIGQKYYLDED